LAATYRPQLTQYVPRVKELVPADYLRLSTSKAQRSTPQTPLPSAIAGRASVIDGDTIEIHGARIRFYGIDAPESNQICYANGKTNRCGRRAAMALADEIGNHVVSCAPKDRDKYGRTVAVCRVDDTDLNAWMVRNGWALAYRQYSTAYIPDENQAKREKAGIWQGNFTAPWDWRHSNASPPASSLSHSSSRTNGPCLIKGNINRRGQHIYHLPGQEYYSRTIITASKGERWFCTEGEARAAGWRRSKR
jgi:endonuclease YncB( thermonuclease family)